MYAMKSVYGIIINTLYKLSLQKHVGATDCYKGGDDCCRVLVHIYNFYTLLEEFAYKCFIIIHDVISTLYENKVAGTFK